MINNIKKLFGKKVFIAGGTGLMGSTAIEILSAYEDIEIYATKHVSSPQFDAKNINWINVDLRDLEQCKIVLKNMDVIFMFAGVLGVEQKLRKDPSKYIYLNNIIYSNMIIASHYNQVETLFLLSSITGYPVVERELFEYDFFVGDPGNAQFGLGWVYRYAEKLAQYYSTIIENPININIIRPTTIYGKFEGFELSNAHFLPSLVKTIIDEDQYEVWGDGNEVRDFVHAKDVFKAFLHIYKREKGLNIYNLNGKNTATLSEILGYLKKICKKDDFLVKYNVSKRKNVKFKKINCDKIDSFTFKRDISIFCGLDELVENYKRINKK